LWYSAKLLFRSRIADIAEGAILCEESIRLVSAPNEEEALERAVRLGPAGEHDYSNERGETVVWEFVELTELQELSADSLGDGTEVYSRLFWSRAGSWSGQEGYPEGPV
jgi:hypothetical protein